MVRINTRLENTGSIFLFTELRVNQVISSNFCRSHLLPFAAAFSPPEV
ncbi:MAG: hypothetical protein Q4C96_01335 [Planctomycetia bacterium]|nr:hypothetical protein [Planctomycetia bacterium]